MPERLEIIITATDKATGVLSKIGSGSKKLFSNVVKLGAAGFGGLGIGLAGAVGLAFDAELSFRQLDQIIRSTGGAAGYTTYEAQMLADSLASVTRFSDEQIESAEGLLFTFKEIGEETIPRATETVLDMAEVFGSADGAAIQLGKALNDPVAGVSALREVGVSFTEEQENMIAAMVEAGDIAGAQSLILDELESEFGGVARAAGDTLAGKLTILKNKFIDVVQSVGLRLIPVLSNLVDRYLIPAGNEFGRFVTVLGNAVESIIQGRSVTIELAEALTYLLGVDWEEAMQWADRIFDVKDAITGFITETIAPLISQHMPAIKGAFLAVGAVIGGAVVLGGVLSLVGAFAALLNPITLIIAAVALLGAAWSEDWGGIRSFIQNDVWPIIQPILNDIKNWLEVTIPAAVDKVKGAFETLKAEFESGGLSAVGTTILSSLKSGLEDVAGWAATNVIDPIVTALTGADWTAIGNQLLEVLTILLGFTAAGLTGIADWLGPNIIDPASQYLTNVNWAGVASRLLDLLLKFWGLEAAGLMTIGQWLWTTLLQPAGEYLSNVNWANVANRLLDVLLQFLGVAASGIGSVGGWIFDNMIAPVIAKLTDPATIEAVFSAAKQIGVAMVNAVVDGLGSLVDAVKDAINDAIPDRIDLGIAGSLDLPDNPVRKMGGLVDPGQMYGVNELGSEGFMPTHRGIVIPHDVMRALKMQTGANYNLTIVQNGGNRSVAGDFHIMKTLAGA